MAVSYKTIVCSLGLLSLCFIGIPLKVKDDELVDIEFIQFVQYHNKNYVNDPVEYAKRYENFKASRNRAAYYNTKHNNTAAFGITKFSDLGPEEFQQMLLRHKPSPLTCVVGSHINTVHKRRKKRDILSLLQLETQPLPSHVDWREKHVVTPVKNQFNCGACWAFSTVETVESMNALRKGQLKEISTQQVIDCARNGNLGCTGGDTCTALRWMVTSNATLLDERKYPLTLKEQKCKISSGNSPGVQLASNFTCYNLVDREEELKTLLAFHGPVTAAVDAVTWQDYLGGIIQYHCQDHTNHAVQIVGYDTRGPIPYYIVRNSWGHDFGIHGYLHIEIGKNLCGVAREVSALDVI